MKFTSVFTSLQRGHKIRRKLVDEEKRKNRETVKMFAEAEITTMGHVHRDALREIYNHQA